jgi:glycosyltransferase involved in cell wall biosynthesis
MQKKISIVLITYNHEHFIEDALKGILMQDFENILELIIADDASTDNTREIINKFKFPQNCDVKKVFRETNVGMNINVLEALLLAKGKYVAIIEGDDFWLSPNKCTVQMEYLEKHPNVSFSWHPVEIKGDFEYPEGPNVLVFEDEIENHFIPTCSVMFRRNLISHFPAFFYKTMSLDIAIELLLLDKGPAHRINNKMGLYRKHDLGISSNYDSKNRWAFERMRLLSMMDKTTNKRHHQPIKRKIYSLAILELKRWNHSYNLTDRLGQVWFLISSAQPNKVANAALFLIKKSISFVWYKTKNIFSVSF